MSILFAIPASAESVDVLAPGQTMFAQIKSVAVKNAESDALVTRPVEAVVDAARVGD